MNPRRPEALREQFVYWLFDADGYCLYVGMTRRPKARWYQHTYQNREMVAQVAYKRMAGPFTEQTARRLEREQQDDLEPIYDARINDMRSRAKQLTGVADPPPRWAGLTFSQDLWGAA